MRSVLGNGELRPGLPVEVVLTVRKRTALAVPSGSADIGAVALGPRGVGPSAQPESRGPAEAGPLDANFRLGKNGSPGLIRTGGRPINSRMLYR